MGRAPGKGGPAPAGPVGNLFVGAGGVGNFGPLVVGADSGISADTNGRVCVYSNQCTGYGWNTPAGGAGGIVVAAGTGALPPAGSSQCTAGGYLGPHQVTGNGDGLSYSRVVVGPDAGGGAGYISCTVQTIWCSK